MFYGIRPASVAMIAAALAALLRICLIHTDAYAESGRLLDLLDWRGLLLFAVILLLTNLKALKKLHPIVFIGVSALVGIVFRFAGA